jgi:hypothetical protein
VGDESFEARLMQKRLAEARIQNPRVTEMESDVPTTGILNPDFCILISVWRFRAAEGIGAIVANGYGTPQQA